MNKEFGCAVCIEFGNRQLYDKSKVKFCPSCHRVFCKGHARQHKECLQPIKCEDIK